MKIRETIPIYYKNEVIGQAIVVVYENNLVDIHDQMIFHNPDAPDPWVSRKVNISGLDTGLLCIKLSD